MQPDTSLPIQYNTALIGPASWNARAKQLPPREDFPEVVSLLHRDGFRHLRISFPNLGTHLCQELLRLEVVEVEVSNAGLDKEGQTFHKACFSKFLGYANSEFSDHLTRVVISPYGTRPSAELPLRTIDGFSVEIPHFPPGAASQLADHVNRCMSDSLADRGVQWDPAGVTAAVVIRVTFRLHLVCEGLPLATTFSIVLDSRLRLDWPSIDYLPMRNAGVEPFDPSLSSLLHAAREARRAVDSASPGFVAEILETILSWIERFSSWIPIDTIISFIGRVLKAAGVPDETVDEFTDGLRGAIEGLPIAQILPTILGGLEGLLAVAKGDDWGEGLRKAAANSGLLEHWNLISEIGEGLVEMLQGGEAANRGWERILKALEEHFGEALLELEESFRRLLKSLGLRMEGSLAEWIRDQLRPPEDAERDHEHRHEPLALAIGVDPEGTLDWWATIELLTVIFGVLTLLRRRPKKKPDNGGGASGRPLLPRICNEFSLPIRKSQYRYCELMYCICLFARGIGASSIQGIQRACERCGNDCRDAVDQRRSDPWPRRTRCGSGALYDAMKAIAERRMTNPQKVIKVHEVYQAARLAEHLRQDVWLTVSGRGDARSQDGTDYDFVGPSYPPNHTAGTISDFNHFLCQVLFHVCGKDDGVTVVFTTALTNSQKSTITGFVNAIRELGAPNPDPSLLSEFVNTHGLECSEPRLRGTLNAAMTGSCRFIEENDLIVLE